MRDYVLALPDLLSYVTMSLTSVVYVKPMPNSSTHINYPRLTRNLYHLCKNIYITLNKSYLVVFVVFLYFVCRQCCEKKKKHFTNLFFPSARVAAPCLQQTWVKLAQITLSEGAN